jgi:hypothetical protein
MADEIKTYDGHSMWLVELDVIGFKGRVFVESLGETVEEAIEDARESFVTKKWNDCSVESVSKQMNFE